MKIRYLDAMAATTAKLQEMKPMAFAELLDINHTHIYRAMKGDFTKTYIMALGRAKLIEVKTRCRLAADVSPEFRAMFAAEAQRRGITNGQLVEDCWRAYRREGG